jgi:choline dehydrogenase-like flavoprotein
MKRAIVVGSGAGGATAAKELQGAYAVTVLEAGREFRPFSLGLPLLEKVRSTGLLFDEREIGLIFPSMQIRKMHDGMVLVNGIGLGGTTTLSAGNALRMDADLKALGIDLDAEFAEISREIPIGTEHQKRWRKTTRRLFGICQEMGLDPRPTPKMVDASRCVNCGRCVVGCPSGAKWDSRQFLRAALEGGAELITGCRVERVVVRDGKAIGVEARSGLARRFYPADLVVLAAGGLATPAILERSGVECEPKLFVDPVLCVATECEGSRQCREITMPFVVQRERFILSPYFDYLSFFFSRAWKHPARNTLALMIKLADSCAGSVASNGEIVKTLTGRDRDGLSEGVELCREILGRLGVRQEATYLGTINAGHPGGTLPLTAREADTLHDRRLPANVYVADATLLPRSLGNPPILTIVALAKRIGKICRDAA